MISSGWSRCAASRFVLRSLAMRSSMALVFVAAMFAACSTAERPVTMTPVKWPDLEKAIAAHKGKIVVLDLWAEF